MTSILIAVAVAILTFGSGLVGLYLQKRLPDALYVGGSKDMILAVIGLVTLLAGVGPRHACRQNRRVLRDAKVRTRNHGISRALMVDQALAQYGREAKPARTN